MKTDPYKDKYDELLQDLKCEKMDWSFEDFIAEAEKPVEIQSVQSNRKAGNNAAWYWLAAAVTAAFGVVFSLKFFNRNEEPAKQEIVKTEILRQHDAVAGIQMQEDSAIHFSPKQEPIKLAETDVMDKILPKKDRLKKKKKAPLAQNTEPFQQHSEVNEEAQNIGVTVNGHQIKNEKEALQLTEYSLRLLRNNVSKSFAQTASETNIDF